jgi:hypothetical protein
LLTDPAAGDKTLEYGGHLKGSHAGLIVQNVQQASKNRINQPHGLEILCMF